MSLPLLPNDPALYSDVLPSRDFEVFVDGKAIPVHVCRVSAMSYNRVWPGHERPVSQSETASFARFDLSSPVKITVKVKKPFREAILRPSARRIPVTVSGDAVSFTLDRAQALSLEIDGRHHNLHLFADAPKTYEGAFTYRFPAGEHEIGVIELHDGESVLIEEGATVYGAIRAYDAKNVRIAGKGILDGSHHERHTPIAWESDGLINFVRSENVCVEGVTLRDSSWWNLTAFNCHGVTIRNVKVIGSWRYNSDGFDMVNSQNVEILDCFLRTFDDTIVFKGLRVGDKKDYERENVLHHHVSGCTLWCDWGGALEIGAETVADLYDDVTYENVDILRNDTGAMRIHSGDRAEIRNVRYENITVEYTKYDRGPVYQESDDAPYTPEDVPAREPVVRDWMYCGYWSNDNIPGHVHDITYHNIAVYADEGVVFDETHPHVVALGADADHRMERVTIDGFTVNGIPVTPITQTNEFSSDIVKGPIF